MDISSLLFCKKKVKVYYCISALIGYHIFSSWVFATYHTKNELWTTLCAKIFINLFVIQKVSHFKTCATLFITSQNKMICYAVSTLLRFVTSYNKNFRKLKKWKTHLTSMRKIFINQLNEIAPLNLIFLIW